MQALNDVTETEMSNIRRIVPKNVVDFCKIDELHWNLGSCWVADLLKRCLRLSVLLQKTIRYGHRKG
jgi:hypothetical protein